MLKEIRYYSRMAWGIREFLRSTPIADPEATIRHQLANRTQSFLDLMGRTVFRHPENPYHEMFRLAGCAHGDLVEEVGRNGLEPTLTRLRDAGVYLTHDEFKGSTPIVRSGREIPSHEGIFTNPLVANALTSGVSSGSRSKGTRSPRSLEMQLYRECHVALRRREFDVLGRARIELKPILPSRTGLGSARGRRENHPVERWFAVGGGIRDSGHYRFLTHCMVHWCQLLGTKALMPTYLPPNDFGIVAEWIAKRRRQGVACVVNAFTSPAVRTAAAALEGGHDISGTLFMVAGEALTDPKRAVIEKTGSEVYTSYAMTELGAVGYGCRQMKSGNRGHLMEDSVACITHRRRAPLSDSEVNALQFTTLLPYCGHVLINADMDDAGVIGPAKCDCLYSKLGFHRQVSEIFSFGKLTGQGMTLVGTDVVAILEEILPARFGGAPGDFQLVEREGAAQTQVMLRVSAKIQAEPEKIRQCFLKELRNCYGGALAARMWSHAEGVEIVRGEPYSTKTGKVHALHLLGPQREVSNAS